MRGKRIIESEKNFDELNRRSGLGILADGADFVELLLHLFIVRTSHMFEDLSCLVEAADRSKISRRIRDQPNTRKQQQRWKALESKEKSPANLGKTVVHKSETE